MRELHCFLPITKFNEINTRLIIERLWSKHPFIRTVVPKIVPGIGQVNNVRFAPDTLVAENAWNIPEPVHNDLVDTIRDWCLPYMFDLAAIVLGTAGVTHRFLANCRTDCQKIG